MVVFPNAKINIGLNIVEKRQDGFHNIESCFYPEKADFFNTKLSKQMGSIDKLSGVYTLKQQIIAGKTEKEIRASWEPGLSQYKEMRRKYLLYP